MSMARLSKFILQVVLFLLSLSSALAINNLRQRHPKGRSCSGISDGRNCAAIAECSLNPRNRCVNNPDRNFDKFKIMIVLPLSKRRSEKVKFSSDDDLAVLENSSNDYYEPYEGPEDDTILVRHLPEKTISQYQMLVAAVTALKHVNERNGSIVRELANLECRYDFNYTIIDSQTTPSFALSDFTDGFLQPGTFGEIDYVVGSANDEVNVPMSIIADVHNIPMISPFSSDPELDDKHIYTSFSRASPSSNAIVHSVAAYLRDMDYIHAAMLYVEGPGTLFKDELIEECSNQGISMMPFSMRETIDSRLNETLDELVNARLNIIIAAIPSNLIPGVLVLAEQRSLVREGRLWLFTSPLEENTLLSYAQGDPEFARRMNGTFRISSQANTESSNAYHMFKEYWSSFATYAHEIRDHLPDGIFAPPYIDNDDLNFSFPEDLFYESTSLPSSVTFAYDSAVAAALALCKADASRKDLRIGQGERSKVLHDVLVNNEFNGASGRFRLLASTGSRDPTTISFLLDNYVFYRTGKSFVPNASVVGEWNTLSRSWVFDTKSIRYYPGNTSVPPAITDETPIDENRIFMEAKAFVFLFAALVYVLVLIMLGWTIKNYHEPVVRASQPFFLALVLVGVSLSTTSVFFLSDHLYYNSNKEFVGACQIAWWFWSIGMTLTTSALIVKMYRIFKLFINPKLRKVKISTNDLLAVIGLLLFFDILVLSIWTGVTPYITREIEVPPFDEFGRPSETYAVCQGARGPGSEVPFIVILLLFQLSLYVVGAFFTFKTRRVSTDFQEGKWIGWALISQLQVFAFAMPIVAASQSKDTTIPFIVLSLIVLLINLVLILVLFLPKIFRLRYGLQEVKYSGSSGKGDLSDNNKKPSLFPVKPARDSGSGNRPDMYLEKGDRAVEDSESAEKVNNIEVGESKEVEDIEMT